MKGTWGQKGPLSKICHKYFAMMKLDTVVSYLKKIQKIYKSRYKLLRVINSISNFSPEIGKFYYIKKYRHDCLLLGNF